MNLAIYGAQGYAFSTYEAIKTLYPKRKITCFLVTHMAENASALDGIPVREIAAFAEDVSLEEKANTLILIATPEQLHPEIEEILENYGFCYYSRLIFKRWSELMALFHAKKGRFLPLAALPVGCHMPFARIYMAKSHADKPLSHMRSLPGYIFPIQVGTGGCSVRIADIADNNGQNISEKNGNYCELTALYWIWKSKLETEGTADGKARQYYGLCQYRRVFDFMEDDLLRLVDNDVDVILPYPLLYEPNIHAHHERYIKDVDWKALLQAVGELQPEYAQVFEDVLQQQYLYNYNVILSKKSVLRDYCSWLFPILERTEELSVPKGNERRDRYIGYIGETLETLYFMVNSDKLNIVHVGCRILT